MQQEVQLNHKFAADFWLSMLFVEKCKFWTSFWLQKELKPSWRDWSWSHQQTCGQTQYQPCHNFPTIWNRFGTAVKIYNWPNVFIHGWVSFSWTLASKTASNTSDLVPQLNWRNKLIISKVALFSHNPLVSKTDGHWCNNRSIKYASSVLQLYSVVPPS